MASRPADRRSVPAAPARLRARRPTAPVRGRPRPGRQAPAGGDRAATRLGRPRRGRALDAARGARRGRRAALRRRAARPPGHAAARGPRDDGDELAWTFERLVRHPDAMERAASGDAAYVDAVIQETQWVRPLLTYVMRTLKAPMTVAGHEVPRGRNAGTSIHPHAPRARPVPPDPLRLPAVSASSALQARDRYGWIPVRRRRVGAASAPRSPRFEMRVGARRRCSPRRRLRRARPAPRALSAVAASRSSRARRARSPLNLASAAVERLEAVGVLLVDHVALDLQRRGQLARLLGEVVVEDRELLDLLDLRVVAVDLVEDPWSARGPSGPPPARPRRPRQPELLRQRGRAPRGRA